eukprot:PhF_6_TR24243/c0_g1_i1/m.33709
MEWPPIQSMYSQSVMLILYNPAGDGDQQKLLMLTVKKKSTVVAYNVYVTEDLLFCLDDISVEGKVIRVEEHSLQTYCTDGTFPDSIRVQFGLYLYEKNYSVHLIP